MQVKYCKNCDNEITHNKKRRLCTDCLKKEYSESNKYYYEKKKLARLSVPKQKKPKIKICKCGNKIKHKFKRNICIDCLREKNRQNYNLNRDKYYAARKLKIEKNNG